MDRQETDTNKSQNDKERKIDDPTYRGGIEKDKGVVADKERGGGGKKHKREAGERKKKEWEEKKKTQVDWWTDVLLRLAV